MNRIKLYLHKELGLCKPPDGALGDIWRCPKCETLWQYQYEPDYVGVTDGILDAGGYDRWIKYEDR